MADGMVWHLEKRCSPKTKDMVLSLDGFLKDHFSLDGPHWNQKYYVAYRVNNFNWLCVQTRPKFLLIDVHVAAKNFSVEQLSKDLKIVKFDKEESLSERLGLPSSVTVKSIRENMDRS